jgi:large subunit ribosomal protein L14
VRQKYPVRRVSGQRVVFEDNAAVIITPEGDLKGTDIKGPVASEAAEKWPRIANLASIIV